MNKEKGLSQVLVLIVAAAVLMMVGLMLVQIFSGNINDTNQGVKLSACQQNVNQICSNPPDDNPSAPATCNGFDGDDVEGLSDDGEEVVCSDT
ncbi:hypothetical protein [Candidatus Nanohalobium constans]|uniref:Uncharacterized protein n=1 Tax=Candidatus Nanohalobium constans TaxID=2565781 RepID=A0A5Q0UGW9_9ARCH|nr:hypothetical protein [Candidatus Nanohalobium constans]QGA80834.1 hypothetical protein LC1Nh_0952 [Candidatus Nanohalobium constans]